MRRATLLDWILGTKRPIVTRKSLRPFLQCERLEDRVVPTVHPWPILSAISGPTATLPTGSDVFAPPFDDDLEVAEGTPIFADWTRTAGPGQSLVITGDKFTSYVTIADGAGSDTRIWVYAQSTASDGKLEEAQIQHLSGDDQLMVTLPADLPEDAMYVLWAENSVGVSAPIAVNQTEAWWIGPDKTAVTTAGETVSIFGRNLSQTGDDWKTGDIGAAPAGVYIQDLTSPSSSQWATVTYVDPYRIDFTIPNGVAALNTSHSYKAWAYNKHGGDYGWGNGLTFTVAAASDVGLNWSGAVYHAADSYTDGAGTHAGVAVNDNVDDSAALQYWINYAVNHSTYATVVLPAGQIDIGCLINLRSNVRLQGTVVDGDHFSTVLKANDALRATNYGYLLYGDSNPYTQSYNLEVADLELNSGATPNNDGTLYVGDTASIPSQSMVFIGGNNDLRFTNVRFYSPGKQAFYFGSTTAADDRVSTDKRIFLTGCEIIAPESRLNAVEQVFIKNCHFYVTNDGQHAILNEGGREIAMTGSSAQSNYVRMQAFDPDYVINLDSGADWGKRFFWNNSYYGAIDTAVGQDVGDEYFAHNSSTDLGTRNGSSDDNQGEQFAWEGQFADVTQTPFSVGVNISGQPTLTFTFAPGAAPITRDIFFAVVVDGPGVGQVRRLDGDPVVSGSSISGWTVTVTLDRAWNVLVTTGSKISLMNLATNAVMYKNRLSGLQENVDRITENASMPLQFGASTNFVIDQNEFNTFRRGVFVSTITGNPTGVASVAGPMDYITPSFFNLVSRNTITNTLTGIDLIQFAFGNQFGEALESNYPAHPANAMLGMIIRDNAIDGAKESGVRGAFGRSFKSWESNLITASNIVESNRFSNTPVGVNLTVDSPVTSTSESEPGHMSNIQNLLFYNNIFSLGDAVFDDSVGIANGADQTPLLVGNVFDGFQKRYADDTTNPEGVVAHAAVEVPTRVLELSVIPGGTTSLPLIIRNVGQEDADWDLVWSETWLTIGGHSSTHSITPAGNSETLVWMTIDASGITAFDDLTCSVDVKSGSMVLQRLSIIVHVIPGTAIIASGGSSAHDYELLFITDAGTTNGLKYVVDWDADGEFESGETVTQNVSDGHADSDSTSGTLTGSWLRVQIIRSIDSTVLWDYEMQVDPTYRNLYFIGSSGDDTVSFSESDGDVSVAVTKVGGQAVSEGETYSDVDHGHVSCGAGEDVVSAENLSSVEAYLIGGGDDDTLLGGGAGDAVVGGFGDDSLDGGTGDDVYVFGSVATGSDSISDASGVDTLDFTSYSSGVTVNLSTPAFILGSGDSLTSGSSFERVFGTASADTITGNSLANTLGGNGGNDTIFGMLGADSIEGGDGADVIFGGYFTSLTGGDGNDTLRGGAGDDTILGMEGADSIYGDDGNDEIHGASEAPFQLSSGQDSGDSIFGGDGNDTIDGFEGDDVIDGGAGIDSLSGNDGRDVIVGGGGSDFITGGADDDFVIAGNINFADASAALNAIHTEWADGVGTFYVRMFNIFGAGPDPINSAYRLNDSTVVNDGADNIVFGDAGQDVLAGSDGDDSLDGGSEADFIAGQAGADILDGGGGADFLDGGVGDDVLVGGQGSDEMLGGDGGDLLLAGQVDFDADTAEGLRAIQAEWTNGGTIFERFAHLGGETGGLNDGFYLIEDTTLLDDSVANTIHGDDGDDAAIGTGGNDSILGGADADVLYGFGGNDTIYGNDGMDIVVAGAGNDVLHGGDGMDFISGDEGDDSIYGDDGGDFLYGADFGGVMIGGGTNLIEGGAGDDLINGGDEIDSINGGGGKDVLFGGQGADSIDGGAGEDFVYSGEVSFGEVDQGDALGAIQNEWANGGGSLLDRLNHLIGETGGGLNSSFFLDATSAFDDGANNILHGGADADIVAASDGNDTLYGDGGADLILGGTAANTIYAGDGDDTVDGGEGADLISGGEGDDTVAGNVGNDVLFGDAGNDLISGDDGRDILVGDDVSDSTITSGDGADSLYGGDDEDILISGRLKFASLTPINAVQTEWLLTTTGHDYGERVANIRGTSMSGYIDSGSWLTSGTHVDDVDSAIDELFGQDGDDWFLLDAGDGDFSDAGPLSALPGDETETPI